MGKLFYGTQTGTTEGVAESIKRHLPNLISEIKCIQFAKKEELEACDLLVLGGSTWGDGELTDDWLDFFPQMDKIDFSGKKVALFSLGDQVGYSYNFVSAMKLLYDKVLERGGEVIASRVSKDGFEFDHSQSIVDGHFVGLVTDEVNEPELTEARIAAWADQVLTALANAAVAV
ncbi:MAG TPA: flavodoxin [Candidatus Melainabacteria bacterium]|nr:flavodoxin [Candidatus Melainabacteria bacterium]